MKLDAKWSLRFFEEASLAEGYRKSTIKMSLSYLLGFLSFLEREGINDIREVGRENIVSYLDEVSDTYSRNSLRSLLVQLRRFFTLLMRHSKILTYPMENLSPRSDDDGPRKEYLSIEEADRFLNSIDIHRKLGLRDRALFELIYSSALRAGEASNLLVGDLHLKSRRVLIRGGKNGEDRLLPITAAAAHYLGLYLPLEAQDSRPLFLSCHNGRLLRGGINSRFHYWLLKSKVEKEGLSAHSLRHSCARHLLSRGANLRYVQELLGHRSVSSTEVYTDAKEENLMRCYKRYHPRENQWYVEVDDEYLRRVESLEREMRRFLSIRTGKAGKYELNC